MPEDTITTKAAPYPAQWPDLEHNLGDLVYVVASNGRVYDAITGIRLETFDPFLDDDGTPEQYWKYYVFNGWYVASALSKEPPPEQVATISDDWFDPWIDSDEDLP